MNKIEDIMKKEDHFWFYVNIYAETYQTAQKCRVLSELKFKNQINVARKPHVIMCQRKNNER